MASYYCEHGYFKEHCPRCKAEENPPQETQQRQVLRIYKELFTIIPRVGHVCELTRKTADGWERVTTSAVIDLVDLGDGNFIIKTENSVYVPE